MVAEGESVTFKKIFKCCGCCRDRCEKRDEHVFPCPSHQTWRKGFVLRGVSGGAVEG